MTVHSPIMGSSQTAAGSNPPVFAQSASSALAGGYGQKIAAGVSILATLAALGFWFWFAIGLISAITNGDVMGGGRVLVAFLASVVLTGLTWWIALKIVED